MGDKVRGDMVVRDIVRGDKVSRDKVIGGYLRRADEAPPAE